MKPFTTLASALAFLFATTVSSAADAVQATLACRIASVSDGKVEEFVISIDNNLWAFAKRVGADWDFTGVAAVAADQIRLRHPQNPQGVFVINRINLDLQVEQNSQPVAKGTCTKITFIPIRRV